MHQLLDILKHLPEHLQIWAASYGTGIYLILALIIFAETGLVVTPFLPGDSLLFATGALVAMNIAGVELLPMILTLIVAAIVGDSLNFLIGRWASQKLFTDQRSRWLNPKHLERTRTFYARHGGKTIVLARFLPILRTYAPFVSGLSGISYTRFLAYSVGGGALWISMFVTLGYYFGNLPAVKANFHYAILAIIGISLVPLVIEFIKGGTETKPAPKTVTAD